MHVDLDDPGILVIVEVGQERGSIEGVVRIIDIDYEFGVQVSGSDKNDNESIEKNADHG